MSMMLRGVRTPRPQKACAPPIVGGTSPSRENLIPSISCLIQNRCELEQGAIDLPGARSYNRPR